MPATGPFRCSLFSGFVVCTGSVLVRRLKKPNRAVLLGLGAGTGAGSVLDLRANLSLCASGVGPRETPDAAGGIDEDGPGDGMREGAFAGTPARDLEAGPTPALDSVELVLLCVEGNAIMLLCIIGDGPRMPIISGVPSRLGLAGRRMAGRATGDCSTKCANSGGACERACSAGIGGLCGKVARTPGARLSLFLPPSVTTVEADEEEVEDSRTVERV